MDPLSATASVIALIQAAKGIGKGVQFLCSLRDVPAEFKDLLDELSTLQSVAGHVQAASTDLQSLTSSSNALPSSLSNIDVNIITSLKDDLVLITHELNAMCDRLKKPQQRPSSQASLNGSTVTERVSIFKWQAEKSSIAKLQQKARNTREHLYLCFAAFSSSQSYQHANLINELKQQLFHSTQMIVQAQERQTQQQTQQLLIGIQASLTSVSLGVKESDQTPDMDSLVTFPARPPNASPSCHGPANLTSASMIRIPLSFTRRCAMSCTCQCHQLQTLQSPGLVSGWLGRLLVQTKAVSLTTTSPCTLASCRVVEQSSLRITYTFPRWLLARSVDFSLSMSALTGAGSSLHLRIPRVFEKHSVWSAIEVGDLSWIQKSLSSKALLPTDIHTDGTTLVLHALLAQHFEMAAFLASQGSDIHAADMSGRTAALWAKYEIDAYGDIHRRNSILHLLEGMASTWMESEIDSPTELSTQTQHPSPDAFGFLPIHWACIRNDASALNTLLAAGADPNRLSSGIKDCTPLMLTDSLECARLLLQAGADPNAENRRGDTPIIDRLHSPDMVRLLLKHGAHPQSGQTSDERLSSPISWTIQTNSDLIYHGEYAAEWATSLDLLIDAGLDINLPEPRFSNMTSLMIALHFGNPTMAGLLVDRNARLDVVDQDQSNILHIAGLFPQLECIEVLRRANISGIDPDQPNSYNWTPMEYMDLQKNTPDDDLNPGEKKVTEEVYQALTLLLQEIRNRNAALGWPEHGQNAGGNADSGEIDVEDGHREQAPKPGLEQRHEAGRASSMEDVANHVDNKVLSDDDNEEFYDVEPEKY